MGYADLIITGHNVDELALNGFTRMLMDCDGRPLITSELGICDMYVSTRL
jgi:hypothetical protein